MITLLLLRPRIKLNSRSCINTGQDIHFDGPNLACRFLPGFLSRLCPSARVLQTSAPKKMNAGWKADPLQASLLDELLGKYIVLYKSCISRASAGIHIGICGRRGNLANSRHFSGGDHDRIAMKLFQ